jgi:acyl-CoA reductase-like NAD-dependent aldehyde dehydrogenase
LRVEQMRRFQHYIDGAFEDGEARFESIDPATGAPWAEMPEAREADVNRAVEAAYRALHKGPWPAMTATARGKLLYKLADLVAENAQKLAEIETRDTGKIIRETSAQIAYVADYYRYYAGLADKIEGAHLSIDKPDMDVWLRREPIGVVAAIVPWNSQLFLAAVKIGPALAAGCTLVVKASEDGPAPLLEFARLVHEAGFPAGVVNIITGFGATCGAALTKHSKIAHVAFTGGPATARQVVRNSAENLASTSLELGGKSPFIVFADADLESAANAQVAGIFAATGQSCVAGSRLIIEASIKDRFLAILKAKAEAVAIGSPLDRATEVGPLCTDRQRKLIETVVGRLRHRRSQADHRRQGLDRPGLLLPPDHPRLHRRHLAFGRDRIVRAGTFRVDIRDRGTGAGPRQRHTIRTGIRPVHPEPDPRPPHDQAHPCRRRVGQHLPRRLADRAVRRLWPVRPGSRRRARRGT